MKKSTNKTSQYRKLTLRKEIIAVLASIQLTNIVGGVSGTACTSIISNETKC